MSRVASLLQLVGVLIVVAAVFMVSAVVGTIVLGVAVFAVGVVLESGR